MAGDSRAVMCRAGKCMQLSDDHKPEREDEAVSTLLRGGRDDDEHEDQKNTVHVVFHNITGCAFSPPGSRGAGGRSNTVLEWTQGDGCPRHVESHRRPWVKALCDLGPRGELEAWEGHQSTRGTARISTSKNQGFVNICLSYRPWTC